MSGLVYALVTFVESVASVLGIRGVYEQPRYAVVQDLGHGAEVRRYEPRLAIEAMVAGDDRQRAAGEAFGLLFRYISGSNQARAEIKMTAPVSTDAAPARIDMTVPVQTAAASGSISMRFFLPQDVVAAGAPAPSDPRLHLVRVPETVVAALRYSGVDGDRVHDLKAAELLAVLATSGWRAEGGVFRMNYDPPFAIPFLRRNEAAVVVTR